MRSRWICHWKRKPKIGQEVWYFWDGDGCCRGGVWPGEYYGKNAYGGEGGFLGGGEVSHWQPRDGRPKPKNVAKRNWCSKYKYWTRAELREYRERFDGA